MNWRARVVREGVDGNSGQGSGANPRRSKHHMAFRKSVRWTVASIMYYSGAVSLCRVFERKPRARILVYHSIGDDPQNPFSVSPEDFEEQVRFLSQAYHVMALEELIACITDGERQVPPDAVVITLDDGFEDNYTNAYPILRRYKVPATIFVIAERLRSGGAEQAEAGDAYPGRYLSWDQALEMCDHGISIGSHTLTHPWLTEMTRGAARREIVESKVVLEQGLGRPVSLFAYPGGRICDFDRDIRTMVAESGYSGACVGLNGTNGDDTDPYLLRRTKIEVDDGMYVFKKAMKGALDVFILLDKARQFRLPAANHRGRHRGIAVA